MITLKYKLHKVARSTDDLRILTTRTDVTAFSSFSELFELGPAPFKKVGSYFYLNIPGIAMSRRGYASNVIFELYKMVLIDGDTLEI